MFRLEGGSPAIDAVVAGHICLDLIPPLEGWDLVFQPGKLVEVGPAVVSTGGPVSNTGIALHILGIRTALMGKTGADALGETLRAILAGRSQELARSMSVVPGEATSYTLILNPPGADRMFLHCTGCNDTFEPRDVDYGIVRRARLFHFGYPPLMRRMIENDGAGLVEVLSRAKACGATVSLDMCMPPEEGPSRRVDWRTLLSRALPFVDLFLPSLDEMLLLLGRSNGGSTSQAADSMLPIRHREMLASLCDELMEAGPSVVGLKLGEAGLYLRTSAMAGSARAGRGFEAAASGWQEREIWSPCYDVRVAGTTGSGDATIAGFIAAVLRRLTPEDCASVACAVGACNVEASDAIGGLRGWEETRRRMAEGWPRRVTWQPTSGWVLHDSGVLLGPEDSEAAKTSTEASGQPGKSREGTQS